MRVTSCIDSSTHDCRLSELQDKWQPFCSTIAATIATINRPLPTATVNDIERQGANTASDESLDKSQLDGYVVEELARWASVARQARDRSAKFNSRRNCAYSLSDNESWTGKPSGRNTHQRRRWKAKTVLPLLANEIRHSQLTRRSLQAVSTNGVLEMLHEDANTNRAFQQRSGSAPVTIASKQPDCFKCPLAVLRHGRIFPKIANGTAATNWCWSKGKIS